MHSKATIGYDDGDYAERASIVADVIAAEAAVAAAQAAAVRAFAKAAVHAERVTRSQPARDRDMATRSLAAEIACAGRMSDRAVQRRINDADVLVSAYPETVTAWAEGRISQGHVRAVTDAGLQLDEADRALFDQAAVPVCEAETPAGAKHLLGMLAERLSPRTLTERHQDARESRSVRVVPLSDGMAELIVILPVTLARAIHDRLTRQARAVTEARERAREEVAKAAADAAATTQSPAASAAAADAGAAADGDATQTSGGRTPASESNGHELTFAEIVASDERTVDQIRTDVLADMLLTACPDNDPTVTGDGPGELGAIRAHVQVTVPVLDLAGVTDGPADLDGRSPIDADTARRLAGGAAGWDRVLTHPITGALLCVDRYTTNAAIQRFLQARDQHCRFPGCRMPAIRCDIDHTLDFALGGRTDVGNLAHLCKRHHTLKHATPWTVTQLGDGILKWTSPLGHTYIDEPPLVGPVGVRLASDPNRHPKDGPPGVRFIPDGNPPPF